MVFGKELKIDTNGFSDIKNITEQVDGIITDSY